MEHEEDVPFDPVLAAMARAEKEGERLAEEEREHWRVAIPSAVRELLASQVDHETLLTTPFLQALVGRLECHENDCTERIAKHQVVTREQFLELEKALQGRCHVVEERLEQVFALERKLERERELYDATQKAEEAEEAFLSHEEKAKKGARTLFVSATETPKGRGVENSEGEKQESKGCTGCLSERTGRNRSESVPVDPIDEHQLRLELIELIHIGIKRLQQQVFAGPSESPSSANRRSDSQNKKGGNENGEEGGSHDEGFLKKSDCILSSYAAVLSNLGKEKTKKPNDEERSYLSVVQDRLEELGW